VKRQTPKMRVCPEQYDGTLPELVRSYSFELDNFQKYAIECIHTERNVLITAHTGSGKTLPAEYAIEYFVSKGKRVIYTSPIKSLSNQKFYDFTKEFEARDTPITIGILTGDIKYNPDADVLIMTTEILRNKLVQGLGDFDVENVACVVYDEIHYINDEDRGKIWEESIMYTPPTTQLILLSATIDKERRFAEWIENATSRETWLSGTKKRVVPLKHLMWSTFPSSLVKTIDIGTLSPLQLIAYKNILQEQPFPLTKDNINAQHSFLKKSKLREFKRQSVLNDVVKYLNRNEMLPAITFVFSRKMCESYANCIETNLGETNVETDEGRRPKVDQEVRYILSTKFTNYREYLELPECKQMISLAERGIGFHHSGVIPIIRELVETLFAKGYIKLLFATETFAVGINMPTRTVLMTGLSKMTSRGQRYLYSHEYTQMAGRAGRRGIDEVGYVIHLSTMMREGIPQTMDYMKIISGRPQTLQSKFVVTPMTVLSMYNDNSSKVKHTMMMDELRDEIKSQKITIQKYKEQLENVSRDKEIDTNMKRQLDEYVKLERSLTFMKPKKKKSVRAKMNQIRKEIPDMNSILQHQNKINSLERQYHMEMDVLSNMTRFIENQVDKMTDYLIHNDMLLKNKNEPIMLTRKGSEMIHLNTHAFVLYDCIASNEFKTIESWITILAICSGMKTNTNMDTPEYGLEYKFHEFRTKHELMYSEFGFDMIDYLMNQLLEKYTYGISNYMIQWYHARDENSCRDILFNLKINKEVLLGDFVKAVLKMVQLAREVSEVANIREDMELLSILSEIQEGLMKYIVTNQSLYI
jgi:superfamily II RNA helicase